MKPLNRDVVIKLCDTPGKEEDCPAFRLGDQWRCAHVYRGDYNYCRLRPCPWCGVESSGSLCHECKRDLDAQVFTCEYCDTKNDNTRDECYQCGLKRICRASSRVDTCS